MQATVSPGQVIVQVPSPPAPPGGGDPVLVYQAVRNQRRELLSQMEELEDQREELSRELRNTPAVESKIREGLEQRIGALDQRILALDKQIEAANAAVSQAAGIPGAIVPPPPPPPETGPPEEFWVIAGMILIPSAFILSIGYARRLWKKGASVVMSIPQDIYDRFTRVEQSIDSVAVEVERIGEGQRYLTRLMSEKAIGAGAAQPVETRHKESERVR